MLFKYSSLSLDTLNIKNNLLSVYKGKIINNQFVYSTICYLAILILKININKLI